MALNNDFKIKNGLTVNTTVSAGGTVEAASFEKHDGTSSQFLKADGSVDSTGYISGIDNSGQGITVDASDPSSLLIEVDSSVVRTTGAQSIAGVKSFSGTICANGGTTTVDALKLTSFDESSDAAPIQTFYRGTCSSADGDYLGQVKFRGQNDSANEVNYAKITGKISDASNGTEDGLMEFAVQKAGSMAIVARQTHNALKLINDTGLQVDGPILSAGQELHTLLGGSGGGSSIGTGTACKLTKYNSAGTNVEDSIVTESSSLITVTGNLSATGTICGSSSIYGSTVTASSDIFGEGCIYSYNDLFVGGYTDVTGSATVGGCLNANGGISVDNGCFNVDGTTGALTACSGCFRDGVTITGDLSATGTTYTDCLVVGDSTLDGTAGTTLNTQLVVQNEPGGQDWFKVSAGNVCFNTAGGTTQVGNQNLGARVNMQAINDTYPLLSLRGVNGSSDLLRISSSACSTGNYAVVKNDGKVGIGVVAPEKLLHVGGDSLTSGTAVIATLSAAKICSNDDNFNTAIGNKALDNNTTGQGNVTIGLAALCSNTTGDSNIAFGLSAMTDNTTGSYNTAIGNCSMRYALSGDHNFAAGQYSLYDNYGGDYNTAIGSSSMQCNIVGSNNTAIGHQSLLNNTAGNDNTSIGECSLKSNVNGIGNTAIGYNSLAGNVTGNYNVAIGEKAGTFLNDGCTYLSGGDDSIYIGRNSTAKNNLDYNSVVIGLSACSCGQNTTVIGNPSTTHTVLHGDTQLTQDGCGLIMTSSGGYTYCLTVSDTGVLTTALTTPK